MGAPHAIRFDDLPPATQAGILCNDPRFQKFAAVRCGFPGGQFNQTATAEYLRTCCKITSRRALEGDRDALRRFRVLKTEFDAWTGKIAAPR